MISELVLKERKGLCRVMAGRCPGPCHVSSPVALTEPSQFMSLHPGDIISTGRPPGVGMAMKPPKHLRVGDEVECGIDGLGQQGQDLIVD